MAAPTYFGSADSTLNQGLGGQFKFVSKFNAPISGLITTGRANLGSQNIGASNVKQIVYADNAGNPGALVGASQAVNIPNGQARGTVTFTWSVLPNVTGGVAYWIGLVYDNDIRVGYNNIGSSPEKSVVYTSEPTDPFGTPGGTFTFIVAVEAGVTPIQHGAGGPSAAAATLLRRRKS